MKDIIKIVAGAVASFVILLLLGVGLFYMKPELFVTLPNATQSVADSTKTKQDSLKAGSSDSLHVGPLQTDTLQVAGGTKAKVDSSRGSVDTVLVAKLAEKARTLEFVVDSLKKNIQATRVKSDSVPVSDWKTTAKLIESMSPEEAGKILKQMSDSEVKQVITKVKTKQAGKILANLDPDRVARILR